MELIYRFGSVEYQFLQISILLVLSFTIVYSSPCSSSFYMSKNDRPFQCDNANSVNVLLFHFSNLQSLSDASFNDFRNVEKLHIWNCVFPTATTRLFAGLKGLKRVTISSSNMPNDIGSMFGENTQVNRLSLPSNSLTTVKGNLSFHFPHVDFIDLKQNKIEEIGFESPSENPWNSGRGVFSYLQKVTSINLSGNAIKYLRNYTFTNLSRIEMLDLSSNSIRKIDAAAISITNVSDNITVNIANNELREVRSFMFYLCSGVTNLYLMNNKISRLENRAFSGLVRLKELSLKNNSIASIVPSVFESLLSLKELDMSDNLLKTIPANVFSECKNVIKIILSGNQIGELHPLALEGLNSFRELFLEANELSQLGSTFTTPLPNLKIVNLQRNRISQVTRGGFEGCLSMEVLDLSRNRISLIENGAFFSNINLRQLNLEHNSLEMLTCATFLNLSSLEILNLDGNALSEFRLSYFSPLRNLKKLSVQLGINSECDCSLFMKMHQQKVHIDIEDSELSESCKSYFHARVNDLSDTCNTDIAEQCDWQPTTTEYSKETKTTVVQNVSTSMCPKCSSAIETDESNVSQFHEESVAQTVFTSQTSEYDSLKTPTSVLDQSKEELVAVPVTGSSLTPQPTASPTPSQQDQLVNETPSQPTDSTRTDAATPITTTQPTEDPASTSNSNNKNGPTTSLSSERSPLGLTTSQIAYSLGGGVVAGVMFGGALCVGIRASRRCRGKSGRGGEDAVPETTSERHVYEEIDEASCVNAELVALHPVWPSAAARGIGACTSVEAPPELPPRPGSTAGKIEIGDESNSQLSSRAYLYVMQ